MHNLLIYTNYNSNTYMYIFGTKKDKKNISPHSLIFVGFHNFKDTVRRI